MSKVPQFYEANLTIDCVDGAMEGIVSNDAQRILRFLKDRDHEGSHISLSIRYRPEDELVHYDDPEIIYRELTAWLF